MDRLHPTGEIADIRSFWHAAGQRAVGVSIVTAADGSGPAGFLCLSVAHVSARPPVILASIDRKTRALETVLRAGHFAVNFLGVGGESLAETFGGKTETKGVERFESDAWGILRTGAPVLRDCVGAIDCELEAAIEREGAVIVIGHAICFREDVDALPLIFYRGSYRST